MNDSLAAIFHAAEQPLELRRVPRPEPLASEVRVRVLGCTLCGSDLHTFTGRRETPTPTILGHEIVGEIQAFGPAAPRRDLLDQPLRVGDRVTWSIVAHCGDCFFCRRELPQKCLAGIKYGHRGMQSDRDCYGGLAEHCLLAPNTSMIRLPEELPLAVACPASCATATIAAALRDCGDLQGRSVCIFGVGLLGLTAAAMLSAAGAETIVCVDLDSDRRERARQFGATHAAGPDDLPSLTEQQTGGHGYDLVLELSGSPVAVQEGLQRARLGGTLVLVGAVFPTAPLSLVPEFIVRRNLTLRGIHNYAPDDLLRAVQFLSQHHGRYPFEQLVVEWFSLDQAAAAFEQSRNPTNIRVGICP